MASRPDKPAGDDAELAAHVDLDVEAQKPSSVPSKRKTLVPGAVAHFFSGTKHAAKAATAAAAVVAEKPKSRPPSVAEPGQSGDYEERMRQLRMQTELEIIKERLAKAEQERKELEELSAMADAQSPDVAARLNIETVEREDSVEEQSRQERQKNAHRSLASSGYTGFAQEDKKHGGDESDDEEKSGKNSRQSSRSGSVR